MVYKGKFLKLPKDTSNFEVGDNILYKHELYVFDGNKFILAPKILDLFESQDENESKKIK